VEIAPLHFQASIHFNFFCSLGSCRFYPISIAAARDQSASW
jgi:hypothetical protein